jgi:ElaA protein
MARTSTQDQSIRHGKMSKDSPVVYRVRNGKQQSYILNENTNPPSKAQNAHRAFFGKVNSLVNAIMADPVQQAEWEKRRLEYNHSVALDASKRRYKTTRSYTFAIVSAQIAEKEVSKRRKKSVQLVLPKGLKLHNKHFSELSTTELYEILKARFIVFYMEQHCYYQDMDDIDYQSTHLALHRKGRVVAYARLFPGDKNGQWHVGRLLSIERGKGYGRYIMEQAAVEAKRLGATSLLLHAQTHAEAFYRKLGYTSVGSVFMEADIPHIAMIKQI